MYYTVEKYVDHIQGNLRKGFGRCRLSCLLHYMHYLSIPLHTETAETTAPEPFPWIPLYIDELYIVNISCKKYENESCRL